MPFSNAITGVSQADCSDFRPRAQNTHADGGDITNPSHVGCLSKKREPDCSSSRFQTAKALEGSCNAVHAFRSTNCVIRDSSTLPGRTARTPTHSALTHRYPAGHATYVCAPWLRLTQRRNRNKHIGKQPPPNWQSAQRHMNYLTQCPAPGRHDRRLLLRQ